MIWLLRHADAADGHPDEARPLTNKGQRQARIAGRALAQLDVRLGACLTSPRVRALDTARLACDSLGCTPTVVEELDGGPFDAERLAAGLGDVLLVGHNPSMQQAVHDLTGARTRFKKAALAAISDRELVALLGPRELAAIAGGGGSL